MSDEPGTGSEEPRVGSTPPPSPPPAPLDAPEPREVLEPATVPDPEGERSTAPPGMTPSSPPPAGEEPDRARKGGRFLTRYAGLPEVGWGSGIVALGVLTAAGAMLIGTIVVAIFDPELNSAAARNAAQLVVALTLAGTALGFALADSGGRIKEAFGKLGLGPQVALGALGLAVFAWLGYLLIAGLLTPLLQPDQEDVTRELGTNKDELGSVAVAAFLIVVAAPVSEELFFRGFMFAGLRRAMSIWPAALISAAVWGALHYGPGNIGVVIQLGVFGVILAWLYERSGTLWAPVLAHAINNTIAFVILVS